MFNCISRKFFAAFFTIVFLALSLAFYASVASVKGEEAYPIVEKAENDLKNAFEAVLEIERAGANVSILTASLNEAGLFLAKAENAYATGNFNEAAYLAESCSAIADNIIRRAEALKGEASALRQTVFWQNLFASLLGSAVFLIALYLVWKWFKSVYFKRLLNMKPEVA